MSLLEKYILKSFLRVAPCVLPDASHLPVIDRTCSGVPAGSHSELKAQMNVEPS